MTTKIPPYFQSGNIDAYSDRKEKFHRDAKKILAELAAEIGIDLANYDIRSNLGGAAVSGEVTLHSDNLYIQMYEASVGKRGVQIMYRSCAHRRDYTGDQNNYWEIPATLNIPAQRNAFILACKKLIATRKLKAAA